MKDSEFFQQQQQYNRGWERGLSAGIEQRGNFQCNLKFIEKINLLKKTDKILEIGCGVGLIVNELSQKGYAINGIDISSKAIKYGRGKFPNAKLDVVPAEELPYDNQTYDIVLSFDLFEHIPQVDRHLSEVSRILKPNGCYLFQTPHKYFSATFDTLSTRSFSWRKPHPSLHTPCQLKKRLKQNGFITEFVKVNPVSDFTINKMKKFGFLANIYSKINFEKLPICLQPNLYVIARKMPRA